MTLIFQSSYCCYYYLPWDAQYPAYAPVILEPPRDFHDLNIPNEPPYPLPKYRQPFVEDVVDEYFQNKQPLAPGYTDLLDTPELHIPPTLTPGVDHYRTRATQSATVETRARMIPNALKQKPRPAPLIARRRRSTKPPPKPSLPLLSVPLPDVATATYADERPDINDIRFSAATNFTQFCCQPGVKAIRITWNELDQAERMGEPDRFLLPDLAEKAFRQVLLGQGDHNQLR